MRIGVDIDDVLANFIAAFRQMAHDRYGVDNTIIPCDWEFSNFGLSKVQLASLFQQVSDTKDFWMTLESKPGTSWIEDAESSHEVFFITSRIPSQGKALKDQTAEWLRETFGIKNPVVLLAREKGPLAAALGLNAFVDDRDKNCIEVGNAVPTCKVFIKDAGHNQGFNMYPRVKDFDEFYYIITRGN